MYLHSLTNELVPDTNSLSINELPKVATSLNNVEYCLNYSQFYQGRIDRSFCGEGPHKSQGLTLPKAWIHWSIREIPWCNLCCNKQGSKTFLPCYWAHDFWKISSVEIISKNAVQTKARTRLDQTTNHNNFIEPLITFIVYTSITVFLSFTNKESMIFTLAIHFIYLKIPINTC